MGNTSIDSRRAMAQAFLAAVLFGVATPFSKSLLSGLSTNLLAGLLYLGAAVLLFLPVLWQSRGAALGFPRDRRNRLYLLGAIFFGGITGPVLLLVGLRYAQAASVSMWLNLETVATAVLAWAFFREHIGRWTWIGNAGVLLAGLLLGFDGGWAGAIGILCILGTAISWGLDNNFTALIDSISPMESTFWKGLVAGGVNLLIGLFFFSWQLSEKWLWALLLGGLSYGASIVLYISSAQSIGATRSQMIFASAPFFGVAFSLILLGEGLSTLQIIAALILMTSLRLILLDSHSHEHCHEELIHDHEHRHDDGHHEHPHESSHVGGLHSHPHRHITVQHSHEHWPDLHHRHEH